MSKQNVFSAVGKNGKGETNIMYNYSFSGELSPLIYLMIYGSFRRAGIQGTISNENITKGPKAVLTHECFLSTSSTDIKLSSKV